MSHHILVIDDDQAILEAVEILLTEDGYQVSVLNNPRLVPDFLAQNTPDLILLDLLLSGEDGRQVAKEIKSISTAAHIPIILMSADTHIKEKSDEAAAETYIKKPFDITELEQTLKTYLKSPTTVKVNS